MASMTLATALPTSTRHRAYPGAQRRGYAPAPAPALCGQGTRPPRPPKKLAPASGGDEWEPDWLPSLRKEAPGGWDYA